MLDIQSVGGEPNDALQQCEKVFVAANKATNTDSSLLYHLYIGRILHDSGDFAHV